MHLETEASNRNKQRSNSNQRAKGEGTISSTVDNSVENTAAISKNMSIMEDYDILKIKSLGKVWTIYNSKYL